MDAGAAAYLLSRFGTKKNTETFSDSKDDGITAGAILSSVISIAIGFYAVYLSWTCNTASGYSTPLKVIFAFFAFIFGLLYLIFYVLVNAGRCGVYTPKA
jgi:hypothetical protein